MLILIKKLKESDTSRRLFGLYKCSLCNKKKKILMTSVRTNKTKSCGCLQKRIASITMSKTLTKHGLSKSPEFYIRNGMIKRCYNKNSKGYENYGGRGITVCQEWLDSFENFYKDIGPRPSNKHLIERKNNNGNYCLENCYWATRKEQNINKRNTILITFNNNKKTLLEWSEILKIPYKTLYARINNYNWTIEKSLTKPVEKRTKRICTT